MLIHILQSSSNHKDYRSQRYKIQYYQSLNFKEEKYIAAKYNKRISCTRTRLQMVSSSSSEKYQGIRNTWFLSEEGSDLNDCLTQTTPCRTLHVVFSQMGEGAVINTVSTRLAFGCWAEGEMNYTINSLNTSPKTICSKYFHFASSLVPNLCEAVPFSGTFLLKSKRNVNYLNFKLVLIGGSKEPNWHISDVFRKWLLPMQWTVFVKFRKKCVFYRLSASQWKQLLLPQWGKNFITGCTEHLLCQKGHSGQHSQQHGKQHCSQFVWVCFWKDFDFLIICWKHSQQPWEEDFSVLFLPVALASVFCFLSGLKLKK